MIRIPILLSMTAALFAQPAQRIVSTSPSITETLFALGLGSRVVGVSAYCHFPAEVERIAKIGTYMQPNIEAIARLKPDLVIVQHLPNSVRDQLQGLSIRVTEVDTGGLHKNLEAILAIGRAAGAEHAAHELTMRVQSQLDALKKRHAGGTPGSVAFIVGRMPGKIEGLMVAGGGSYLSELMTAAGGRNVFADSNLPYVKTSYESLLRRNPDVLIDMGEMAETVGVTETAKRNVVNLWGTRPALKAVQDHRVYAVASDIFVVPGPRMVDAAQAFAEMLYPEPRK